MEHVGQPAIFLPHQITHGAALLAEIKSSRRLSTATHLVKQAGKGDFIALAQRAVVINQELGHDKQGYSLDATGGTFDSRQHQVNNVLVQLMVAAGNPYLIAADTVGPVVCRFSSGGQVSQAGSRSRLTHGHSAGKAAAAHGLYPFFLLGLGAVGCNEVGIGIGQADITHGSTGSGTQVGARNCRHQCRQLHTAEFIISAR